MSEVRAGRAARDAAVTAVRSVRTDGSSLDAALNAATERNSLDGRDRAFALLLAATTLRRWGSLGVLLESYLNKGWPPKSGPLREMLSVSAAQMVLLEGSPYAAIDLAVSQIAKHRRTQPYKNMANAVLRRVAETGKDRFADIDPVTHDVPDWLLTRWTSTYGVDLARQIARASVAEAALDITPRDIAKKDGLAEQLGGVPVGPTSVRLSTGGGPIAERHGFRDGAWWVQDASAAIPATLIQSEPGARVFDL
ncbi:MAG: transcription antitermination factor NusB, partial [Pseudomonadota bacterium]